MIEREEAERGRRPAKGARGGTTAHGRRPARAEASERTRAGKAASGRPRARKAGQLALPGVARKPGNGNGWGGRRKGAGRKPKETKAGVAHTRRPSQSPRLPLHITVRLVAGLPRLRRRKGYQLARRALALANRHEGVRLCEVSIQGNHLHFVGEVDDRAALTRAMRSFNISFAKNVNFDLARRDGEARKGRVLADRYHVVVLRTPAQTRATLEYVLGNWRRHGEDRRESPGAPRRRTDRYSSGPFFTGWLEPAPAFLWWKDLPWPEDGPLPIRFPRSWLLREGWKRGGLLSPWHRPGPRAAA